MESNSTDLKTSAPGETARLTRRSFMEGAGKMALLAGSGMAVGTSGKALAASDEFINYDALGLAELVKTKKVKPVELLDAAIQRVENINPKLNAVVTKMYDEARATIAKGTPQGPFGGVPFLMKDLATTYAGVRNTSGSRLFAEYVPNYDNVLVSRYKAAGLVTMGRTNTPAFGLNVSTESALLGPARNPWDLGRSTGGSSGGSSAAVAARIVPLAHANDGGGSIRIPASCCGVFGLKPSRGRTPNGPEFGEVWEGFATGHAVSISVRDNAALLDASIGPELGAPYGIPAPARPYLQEVGENPGKLKIAYFTEVASKTIHPDCVAATEDAAELCRSLGHTVEQAAPKVNFEQAEYAFHLGVSAHAAAMLDVIGMMMGKKITPEMVEAGVWAFGEAGRKASAADLAASKGIVNMATRTVGGFLAGYDVVLTPTLATPPNVLGHHDSIGLPGAEFLKRLYDFIPYTWLHNLTGTPAMSVPLYWNKAGLPIGVQFAAGYAKEATLYRLAAQLEQARPWAKKIPPNAA